jgi:hypothetical protein
MPDHASTVRLSCGNRNFAATKSSAVYKFTRGRTMLSTKFLAYTLVVAACAGTANGFVAPTGRMPTGFLSRLSMANKESVLIIGGTRCECSHFPAYHTRLNLVHVVVKTAVTDFLQSLKISALTIFVTRLFLLSGIAPCFPCSLRRLLVEG